MTAVEAEIEGVVPADLAYDFYDTTVDVTKAENAIKPEVIALGVFAGIAALAVILIAAQLMSRQLRFWAEETTVRALGADPAMIVIDGVVGLTAAVVVGAVLAAAVAVALSPLAPLGPVRPVYPDRGVAFDWTVLGLGVLGLIVVLGSVAVALAVGGAPRPGFARGWQRDARSQSRIAGAAASAGLWVPAVTGIRFALEPGAQSEAVPVRSAILGTTLAIVVVIATVVFGASLD